MENLQILIFLKRKKGSYTARPRTLQLGEGTISLGGFSKEQADKLEAHLEQFFKVSPPTVVPEEVVGPSSSGIFKEHALALRENGKIFEIVTVGFDAETKEARVEQIEAAGPYRRDALTRYKILADKFGHI